MFLPVGGHSHLNGPRPLVHHLSYLHLKQLSIFQWSVSESHTMVELSLSTARWGGGKAGGGRRREVEGDRRKGETGRETEKKDTYFLLNATVLSSFTSTSRPHRLWKTSGPVTQLSVKPEFAASLPPDKYKNTPSNPTQSVVEWDTMGN